MGKAKPLVINEYKLLIEAYPQIKDRLRSPSLTDEERALCQLRVITIEGIFSVLNLMEQKSDKQRLLLNLCLSDKRCSRNDVSQEESDSKYKSVDSMRAARNQLRFLLAATLFKTDKVAILLQSNSYEELLEITKWYANVIGTSELKRLYNKR